MEYIQNTTLQVAYKNSLCTSQFIDETRVRMDCYSTTLKSIRSNNLLKPFRKIVWQSCVWKAFDLLFVFYFQGE